MGLISQIKGEKVSCIMCVSPHVAQLASKLQFFCLSFPNTVVVGIYQYNQQYYHESEQC